MSTSDPPSRDGSERPAEGRVGAGSLFDEIELFGELTGGSVDEIAEIAEPVHLESGEVLFEQGDQSEAMYVLASGRLEVRAETELGDEVDLAELGPGEIVGEMSLIEGGERSASVRAVESSRLFELRRRDFERMRAEGRRAAYELLLGLARLLGRRRREAEDRVRDVFEDPEAHLEAFEQQVYTAIGRLRKG